MSQNEAKISHPVGIVISRDLKEHEVATIEESTKNDMGTGYVWYSIPPHDVFGKKVTFSLCFLKGMLESFTVCLVNPEIYGSSWDDWSEDKERLRAKHTGKWLTEIGFSLGSYSWGDVWAGYDTKGGCGSGRVSFHL